MRGTTTSKFVRLWRVLGQSFPPSTRIALTATRLCVAVGTAGVLCHAVASAAPRSNYDAALAALDDATESNSGTADAYATATKLAFDHPLDPRVLWRAARAAYNVADATQSPASKKALLAEAYKFVQDAKALPDGRNSHDVYRWSGIILEAQGQFLSTKEYIRNAFVVREDFETAVAINPNDSSALHLLGRWCLSVADMPSWKRSIAGAIFAEPPKATYAEALDYFTRAESISPGWWKANQYYLALVNRRLDNKSQAVSWLESAVELPGRSADDATNQELALKALAELAPAKHAAFVARRKERQQLAAA